MFRRITIVALFLPLLAGFVSGSQSIGENHRFMARSAAFWTANQRAQPFPNQLNNNGPKSGTQTVQHLYLLVPESLRVYWRGLGTGPLVIEGSNPITTNLQQSLDYGYSSSFILSIRVWCVGLIVVGERRHYQTHIPRPIRTWNSTGLWWRQVVYVPPIPY